jgi:hypothetical protein
MPLFIALAHKICAGNVEIVRTKGWLHPTMIEPAKSLQCSFRPSCGQTGVDRCGPSYIRKFWTGLWRSRLGKRDD